jgi:acyl-[acyl-carrier-protein]-phospholipid O-acyltransferase/long-chain-fatty-acid--[acyl-carrier-protein] ligase
MKSLLTVLFRWLFNLRVHHQDRLQFSGPSVIMPNHVSFLDVVLLYLILPSSVWFVVNSEIAAQPLVRFALRFRAHVKIDNRNPYSLRTIIGVVRAGNPVVLFPEGRISTTGNLMKMYTGAAMVARKTDAKVYPVILRGPEYSKLSRVTDKLKSQWFPNIQVYVGEPQTLLPDENLSFRAQKEAMNHHLLNIMQQAMLLARRQQYDGLDFFRRLQLASRQNGSGKVIVRDLTRTVTYLTLFVGIHVLAKKLRTLLSEEDKSVATLLPNAVAHVSILFALFYLGKTPAIFNFSTGIRNVVDSAANAGVKTVLTSRLFIEKANLTELVAQLALSNRIVYLEDLAATVTTVDKLQGLVKYWRGSQSKSTSESRLILFTSGTEGRPKGVVLSHRAILANIDQASSLIDYTSADRMLNALPMFHSFGLMAGTLLPILGGVELFLYPSPLHYRILPELAYDFNATLMLGTPTFLAGYGKMAHPYDFHRLRYLLAGGEKLRQLVRELWQNKFGIRILEGYGITETGPVLCLNTPLAARPGTVGRFLPGIEWRLEPVAGIDTGGNLLVRGPNLMEGYLLYEKGFQPVAEWYATGDVVSVDADGFVTIHARLKRFAKIAGEMINLQQVEESAAACFGSGTHAAVAAGGGRKGERIVLFTTNSKADRNALREYLLQEGHSGLSVPAEIIRLEKMPLLGTGKPDYLGLQQQAEQAIAGEKP